MRKSEIGILEVPIVAINIMQAPPGYLINFALLNFGGGSRVKRQIHKLVNAVNIVR